MQFYHIQQYVQSLGWDFGGTNSVILLIEIISRKQRLLWTDNHCRNTRVLKENKFPNGTIELVGQLKLLSEQYRVSHEKNQITKAYSCKLACIPVTNTRDSSMIYNNQWIICENKMMKRKEKVDVHAPESLWRTAHLKHIIVLCVIVPALNFKESQFKKLSAKKQNCVIMNLSLLTKKLKA